MAKKLDPFDKFKAATLGRSGELIDAISSKRNDDMQDSPSPGSSSDYVYDHPSSFEDTQNMTSTAQKISKNADRELVSFHVAKDLKKKLGLLKYETDRSFGDLYSEAIEDLLKKYGKL